MKRTAIKCRMSFGDCMFTTALTRAVAKRNRDGKVSVFTDTKYSDAFYNLPWVSRITCDDRHLAADEQMLDVTPTDHFWHYNSTRPGFCLFDTQLERARDAGIPAYDQRPIFRPTEQERLVAQQFAHDDRPLVAIESAYFSGQSWSTVADMMAVVEHYAPTHRIAWLSNQDCPRHSAVDNCLRFSRRELIQILSHCEMLYTTGSGFFCASLAHSPGPRTICLWRDDTYHYEARLHQLGWRSIEWVHDRAELEHTLR